MQIKWKAVKVALFKMKHKDFRRIADDIVFIGDAMIMRNLRYLMQ